MDRKLKKLILKTGVFILSLSFAWWLIKSGYLQGLIEAIMPLRFVSEILAGFLYTSFLSAPISVAMLIVLAQENNPIVTALLAGVGAALADLLMIKFFRGQLYSDLNQISKQLGYNKFNIFLQKLRLGFIVPLIGAIIVASPFPDEIGLFMLGASKLRYQEVALLTYILNTAGILLIVLPINLIS
ncbi:hypothetical protein A2867_00325 [Candidatus Daviesbacteria bacterium RIFCSPHIGHO2_01_FULL_40_11]|uniref:TVP38/TMEM64 family membrane protein n=1 Tax=Candidatus Daviesbacteria bacterium RIFCSPHIGHO2_01_FULL_40_11 TaxID=1797762 RepID=A0A1F5JLR4_9BACT|nr:MAG: hypothetical protein A2867_00325 [Candidatus Daviesbacteria bacterium RIFCSPHIGHO2_01_FULL_40_11]OGE62604.1 MAG: hypothetical protein A2964_00215 [Candidatus Daviesbacteria bacterium RIFCSPLOWO2_01_FULL_40_27]